MRVLDPGHQYELSVISSHLEPERAARDGTLIPETLTFVKRVGDHYPGNKQPQYSGTTTQEVIRALIDRTKYVDNQIPSNHNVVVIDGLRSALYSLELRAAAERGDRPYFDLETCATCGHVLCRRHQ
jgi:hypothetical protein